MNPARILWMAAMACSAAACGNGPSSQAQPPVNTAQAASSEAHAAGASEQMQELADSSFVGRAWISTTPGSPRGSLLIFLPDRTLLMDSCFETYRLSRWGVAAADRVRWIEDRIPIEATVEVVRGNTLRLQIAGRDDIQTYVAADVPYVCPDMPR